MMDSSVHQLYHILNAGGITYCLICMEDICDKLNFQSGENPVKVHLSCTNHQDNVKFLFKLCLPDFIDDEFRTKEFLDIMRGSVFDISGLLGKNTCYICCKNNKNLVCLLCREEVSKVELPCKKIRKRIINHLQSDNHYKSIKNTNWIYYFNSKKNFFRFHKSLLYCSVCKESFQLEESNLLQFSDSHLKTLHKATYIGRGGDHSQNASQAKSETKTSNFVRVISFDICNGSSSASFNSRENSADLPSNSCVPLQNNNNRCYTCHLCLADIEIVQCGLRYSIDNHCMNKHLQAFQDQGSSLFKDIICFNQRFIDHKVIVKKYPGIKVLSDCVPVFGNNSKYIQIFENLCFCRLCSIMISFDPDPNNLLRNFSTHFHSVEHMKVLKRKGETGYDKAFKKKSKDLKRLQKSQSVKDSKKSSKKKVINKTD